MYYIARLSRYEAGKGAQAGQLLALDHDVLAVAQQAPIALHALFEDRGLAVLVRLGRRKWIGAFVTMRAGQGTVVRFRFPPRILGFESHPLRQRSNSEKIVANTVAY